MVCKQMPKCFTESGPTVDPPMHMLILLAGNHLLFCGMGFLSDIISL